MKKPIKERQNILLSFLAGEINKAKAADLLSCTPRTIENYRKRYKGKGVEGLVDHRYSNHHKLSKKQHTDIINLKETQRWRSTRNIRYHLRLSVSEVAVWKILHKQGLTRENIKRVKAIQRFEAEYPNQMWQTDIMGKIDFPNIGILYLIATLDDHSRSVPAGKWYRTQGKMNVFQIWYESLSKCGLPDKMLQDEGSQYKAIARFGTADYEWYAKQVGIKLIWAKSAQCKGKVERFWKFVQKDFVPEVLKTKTVDEVNGPFKVWLAKYNYVFKSRYFGNITHASKYKPSERKLSQTELQTLLTVEERRKVTRESTISLYGKYYYIPKGYIGCRIWVKIKGETVRVESMGNVVYKFRLRA